MLDDSDDEGDVPPLLNAPPTPAKQPVRAPTKAAQPAVTPPAADRPHKAGDLVTLDGLVSKPELNGREARITGYDEAKARFAVELLDSGTRLSLKGANLVASRSPAPGKGPGRPKEAGGVKKGFLGGGGGASTKKAAAAERPDLTVVRKAEGADPLRLADVQKSMDEQAASSSAAKVGGAPEWVTPALLQQIASDPLLRKAFTDPKCAAAMAALQQDPKKAMETYKDVPEMKEFLVKFMGLMGEHFTALADAAPPAAAPVQPVQPVQPASEEEQRVHKAMQDPEAAA